MKFTPTAIAGVVRIDIEPHADARGFFARLSCGEAYARAGHPFRAAQTSLSRNRAAGTLRGMHYQDAPHAETKVVRAVRGRAYDVAVDLRPHSPTFRAFFGCILDADEANALLIPEGCAHGFLTLEADTDILYEIDKPHVPGHARGFRFDDPAVAIAWPRAVEVISPADLAWAPLG